MVILTPMQIGGKIRSHLFRYGFFTAEFILNVVNVLFSMTFDTRLPKQERPRFIEASLFYLIAAGLN